MYETETKWTPKEMTRMSIASIFKIHRVYLGIVIFAMLAIIGFGLFCGLCWNPYLGLFCILMAVAMPFMIWVRIILTSTINYNSNKIIQENSYRMSFQEDQVMINSPKGVSIVKYADFYKVIETKTNFYFFIGRQQAYTAIKANCSEELQGFLHLLLLNCSQNTLKN